MEYRQANVAWKFPAAVETRALDDVPRCRCLLCRSLVRVESLGEHKHFGQQQVTFEYVGTVRDAPRK